MFNFLIVGVALAMSAEAESDTQKIVAGALLAAALGAALREINGVSPNKEK